MASRRDLIRMTDDEVREFLDGRHVMNIATHGPDGNIHLVAMWYGFTEAGNPAFETYAKSQKVRNLQRDPRITVLVEDGESYDELRGVELVGTGIVHEDPDVLIGVARSVVKRYFEWNTEEELDLIAAGLANKRVAIEILPDKVVSWDHNKLGGTY